ncbi:hypothetical protein BDZ91DRAFT_173257 [Kalaharituber pfeilii]|nr:hypothetical protein BDZ91DRAFT_173257 [Kalaharituber pfeilii]
MSYTSSAASSRRQSMMLPPSGHVAGSIGIGSEAGVGPGPGPQRHPKPLTAAELHLQLEREQEAVVNRLTRELAALRAQQAHNSSAILDDPLPLGPGGSPIAHHTYSSPHIPRHHRTSSNTSTSAVAGANSLSRQNSTRSIRSVNTGGRSSPAMADLLPLPPHAAIGGGPVSPSLSGGPGPYPYAGYYGYQYQGGLGIATPSMNGSETHLPLGSTEVRGSSLAEAMQWKAELENVKKENEALRQRVKELEKILKEAGGVEPEGWNGGGVGAATHFGGGRSRSSSIKSRGRKERRHGEEVKPKKEEQSGEKGEVTEGERPTATSETAALPVSTDAKVAAL